MIPIDLYYVLQMLEVDFIMQALAHCDGNKTHAARLLGMKRTRLVERLRALKLLEHYPAIVGRRRKRHETFKTQ